MCICALRVIVVRVVNWLVCVGFGCFTVFGYGFVAFATGWCVCFWFACLMFVCDFGYTA